MISKKRLRERLIDIGNGAGCWWDEDGYFEFHNATMASYQMYMRAVVNTFHLEGDDVSRLGWLGAWDDIESLTERIHHLIEAKEAE